MWAAKKNKRNDWRAQASTHSRAAPASGKARPRHRTYVAHAKSLVRRGTVQEKSHTRVVGSLGCHEGGESGTDALARNTKRYDEAIRSRQQNANHGEQSINRDD